jgi:hypothetical protein
VRLAHIADNSAVLVVPNVEVRMEAQHSIRPLSLHDFLWESFFTFFNFAFINDYSLKFLYIF